MLAPLFQIAEQLSSFLSNSECWAITRYRLVQQDRINIERMQLAYLSGRLNYHEDRIEYLVAGIIFRDQRSRRIPPAAVSEGMEQNTCGQRIASLREDLRNSSKTFEQDIRAAVPGLPDLSEKGLNRGLPLAQGQHWMPRSQGLHKEWLTATGQTSHCFNCGRPGDEACDEKGWVGWFENRRCQPCYNWRWTYGHGKPQDLITDKELHDIWVSKGNKDACGNPACQEPRNPERGTFNFWGPDMRCGACSRYKNTHGIDPESPRLGLTAAKHPSWVAGGNDDVYGTCHTPRPTDSHLLRWQGWMTL
ncbi:hypothetical protein HG530_007432 [Fusarium avenaceum]|nr:hypothetical protein HG530_007432 [Fusarium avenaceum]